MTLVMTVADRAACQLMPIQTFQLEWKKCHIKETKPHTLLTNKDIYAIVKKPTII